LVVADRLALDSVVAPGGVPQVADPIRLSSTPVSYRLAPPALGEHNAEVLGWLGAPPAGDPGAVTPP
jgi:crotonobetainyl-CoA:carnitine CoA-transferase CaiB-like acyl-CoA transferase